MRVCEESISIRPMERINGIFPRTLHDPVRDMCGVHFNERPIPVFVIKPYRIHVSTKVEGQRIMPDLLSSSPDDT